MTDAVLMLATQDAVITGLKVALDPSLGPVREFVPQGAEPPFFRFDAIEAERCGGKSDPSRLMTFDVHSVYRGTARRQLLMMMGALEAALVGVILRADGVAFSPIAFESSAASGVGPDGATYAGISSFSVIVEPA